MQTVLIVDDMAVIRAPLAAALIAAGYRAVTAESGQDALAKIRASMPDLVLLDVTMPGMDGLAVLRTLRKEPATASLPVILLTASSAKHVVVEAARIGIQDYLVKSGPMLSIAVTRVQKCLSATPATAAARNVPAEGTTDTAAPTPAPTPKASLAGVPLLSREETTRRIERAEVRMLPRAIVELITLINSGKGSVADAAVFLQRDPVLFARLLRVANSAAVGHQHERITTLEEAIALFGGPMVQNLIVAVGVHEIVADRAGGKAGPALWHHCLAVAALMEQLAPAANLPASFAYMVGLCHELPEALLHHHFPKHYRHATDLASRGGEPLHVLQAGIFGMSHGELMRLLLTRLKFPPALSAPLGQFFDAGGGLTGVESADPLARLLLLADTLANGLMLAPGMDHAGLLIRAASAAAAFGANIPTIDPLALRADVAKTAGLLAETATAGASQTIEPMLPGSAAKLLYVRDEEYSGLDPLLLLLQATCASVTLHVGLDPLPSSSHDADAVIVAAPFNTPAAELISLVHLVSPVVRGRPALCLSATDFASCEGAGGDVKTPHSPLTLHTLGDFLKSVASATVAPAAAARAA